MSTRSDIIVHRADGSWKRVYCHFDGYLGHVGQTLFDYYNNQAKADQLVAPGDMSSLAERCDKPHGHSYDNPVDGCTVYYGRDRGETDVNGFIGSSLEEAWPPKDSWTEFTYVFDDGKWYVADPGDNGKELIELGRALANEEKRR